MLTTARSIPLCVDKIRFDYTTDSPRLRPSILADRFPNGIGIQT